MSGTAIDQLDCYCPALMPGQPTMSGLLEALGHELRWLRVRSGLRWEDVAPDDATARTFRRAEVGRHVRSIDAVVHAYAEAVDDWPSTIWADALARWRADCDELSAALDSVGWPE